VHDPWTYRVVDDAAQEGVDGVHGLYLGDVDRDGKLDIVASSGQPKGALRDSLAWFRVPSDPLTATRWECWPLRATAALRRQPRPRRPWRLNGDGRPDMESAAKDSTGGNWFAWWEQGADPRRPWKKHLIAENQFAPPTS
jgi:hypothetical protein